MKKENSCPIVHGSNLTFAVYCVHKRKYQEQIPRANAIGTVYAVKLLNHNRMDLNARQPLMSLREKKKVSQLVNSSKTVFFLYWAAG